MPFSYLGLGVAHSSDLPGTGATDGSTIGVIAIVGIALAVLGLGFAAWQMLESRRQAKDLEQINTNARAALDRLEPLVSGLDRVAHALPTRVLGDWPGYITDLARFVSRTERELKILCDVPSYGIASNIDGYLLYQRAIEQCLVDGKSVSTIFLSAESRRQLNEQFTPTDTWTHEFRTNIARWADRLRELGILEDRPTNRVELIDAFEMTNLCALEGFQSAALLGSRHTGRRLLSHCEADGLMPLYVWVRDGAEAVFAVALLPDPGKEIEIAFVTIDPGLVAALEGVFDRYSDAIGSSGPELAVLPPAVGGDPGGGAHDHLDE
jgi:hypothetical protein